MHRYRAILSWLALSLSFAEMLRGAEISDLTRKVGRIEPLAVAETARNAGLFIGIGQFETNALLSRLKYTVDDAIAMAHLFVLEFQLIPPAHAALAGSEGGGAFNPLSLPLSLRASLSDASSADDSAHPVATKLGRMRGHFMLFDVSVTFCGHSIRGF